MKKEHLEFIKSELEGLKLRTDFNKKDIQEDVNDIVCSLFQEMGHEDVSDLIKELLNI